MRYTLALIAAATVAFAAPLDTVEAMPTVSRAPVIPLPKPTKSNAPVITLPKPIKSTNAPVVPLPTVIKSTNAPVVPLPTVIRSTDAPVVPLPTVIRSTDAPVIPLPTVIRSSDAPVIPLPSVVHPVIDPPVITDRPVIDPPVTTDRPVIDPPVTTEAPVVPLPSPVPDCMVSQPVAIVKAEEQYYGPGSGKNTSLIVPLNSVITNGGVLSHVTNLHLAAAVNVNEHAVVCRAYADAHGHKQIGAPFLATEPLRVSSGAGYVGSVKCTTK